MPTVARSIRIAGICLAVALWTLYFISSNNGEPSLVAYDSKVAERSVQVDCPIHWSLWIQKHHLGIPGAEIYGVSYKPQHHIYLSPEGCTLKTGLGLLTNTHESMHIRHPKYDEASVEACAIDYLRSTHRLSEEVLKAHRSLLFYYQIGICAPSPIGSHP